MKTPSHISVLVYEPGKPGEVRRIRNTLESLQAIVGGYIESIPHRFGPAMQVFANEDGRSKGLLFNMMLDHHALVGTVFFARCKPRQGELTDITDADVELVRASVVVRATAARS